MDKLWPYPELILQRPGMTPDQWQAEVLRTGKRSPAGDADRVKAHFRGVLDPEVAEAAQPEHEGISGYIRS